MAQHSIVELTSSAPVRLTPNGRHPFNATTEDKFHMSFSYISE